VRFQSTAEAEQLLRRLGSYRENELQFLRAASNDPSVHAARTSVAQAAALVARKMRQGRLVLLERIDGLPEPKPIPTVEPKEKVPSPSPPRRKEKVWVEFRVVEADTGGPIGEVDLAVTLPDGTVEECQTDAQGMVRFSGIEAGNCSVSSPYGEIRAQEASNG
jgi:hypothetical protein